MNWLIKESVSITEQDKTIILKRGELTLLIPEIFEISVEKLKTSRRLVSTNDQLFDKILKKIYAYGWLSLEIDEGIVLESFPFDLPAKAYAGTDFIVSSGTVTLRHKEFVTVISSSHETKITFSLEKYLSYLRCDLSLNSKKLLSLCGLYNAENSSGEILAEAFHFSTVTTDVSLNKNFIAPERWTGFFKAHAPSDQFEKVLMERKSVTDSSEALNPEEIKSLLHSVYLPHNGNPVKLAYPSPGKMYSAQIRIVMPSGDVLTYNPIEDKLSSLGNDSTLCLPNWVRIFVVGATSDLEKKYQHIPYRLLLLETGVLLQQLSLVTSYKSFKGYIVGMLEPHSKIALFLDSSQMVLGEYRLGK